MSFNNKRKYKPHQYKNKNKYNNENQEIVHMAQFKTYKDFERRMNIIVNLIQNIENIELSIKNSVQFL